MDAGRRRTELGETGNPGWRERRRTDGAGWGHAGPLRVDQGDVPVGDRAHAGAGRRSAFRRVVSGVPSAYRRTIGTARCAQDEFVAEIGVNGAFRHIGASDRILEFVPPLQDSGGYEGGQSAGEGRRRDEAQVRVRNPGERSRRPPARYPQADMERRRTATPGDMGGVGGHSD